MHLQPVAEVPDVVEGTRGRGAHEGVNVGAQLHQALGQMGAHEPVRPGHENGSATVDIGELRAELVQVVGCPDHVVGHRTYAFASVKRTPSAGLGSLAAGAVTAFALAVQTGLAAVVGVIIAREFGRTAETDGFFAAYAVFVVLALAATASRLVMLPPLARAQREGRLAEETIGYGLSFALVGLPLIVAGALVSGPVAAVITGFGSDVTRDAAGGVLPWMLVAGVSQLFAGLGASALAALDDYVAAAVGYVTGSILGLTTIVLAVDVHGVAAVSWGMAVNGIIACVVPWLVLVRRSGGITHSAAAWLGAVPSRLVELARGISFPLALQAVYLISVPFAARDGVGAVTSLGYGYLAGSALVAVTASSLGLVTSAPLARGARSDEELARHIIASAWPAVVASGATAGVFTLGGKDLLSAVLGPSYDAGVGSGLGHLVAWLTPWMVITIVVSVALPLVFVAGRQRRLPLTAAVMVVAHVPLALAGQRLFGLPGLACALALSTAVGLVGLLSALGGLASVARGIGVATLIVGCATAAAFGAAGLVTAGAPAALLGLGIFTTMLVLVRPVGLRDAVRHLRHLA